MEVVDGAGDGVLTGHVDWSPTAFRSPSVVKFRGSDGAVLWAVEFADGDFRDGASLENSPKLLTNSCSS